MIVIQIGENIRLRYHKKVDDCRLPQECDENSGWNSARITGHTKKA